MSEWRCPGQDMRFWQQEDIFETPCPHCGQPTEFWRPDVTVRCPQCGQTVPNPKFDPGCAAWCSHAVQCLGEIAATFRQHPGLIRDRLEAALRKALTEEDETLEQARQAAAYAEQLTREEGAEMAVTVAAALLHSLSPAAAMEVLHQVGLEENTAGEIMQIITMLHQPVHKAATNNFQVVADAVSLAGSEDPVPGLYTAAARKLATNAHK